MLYQIHCRNITVFPIFEEHIKPGVLSVSIRDSDVAGLPPSMKDEWDRLKDVSFLDTPLLSCTAIDELRRPGLRILSNCECPSRGATCKEGSTCLATLLILIFLVAIGLGFILYMLRRLY